MTEILLPGQVHRQTEFVQGLTGACGPNALAMGQAWAMQADHVDTYGVYTDMYRRGLCAASGASTLDALHQEAQNLGMPLTAYRGYGEPWPADGVSGWRAFYLLHAGHSYILMETANGQQLRDSISGQGENATNLHYHFIGIVGHHDGGYSVRAGHDLPVGWWAVDGDSYAAGDVLQFYPDEVMAAAQPCGALAFGAKVSIAMAWTRQGDGTGRDAKGHTCGQGFMADIAAHGGADGLMSETYPAGVSGFKSFLPLGDGAVLMWDGANVSRNAAVVAKDLFDALVTAQNLPHATPADPQIVKDATLGANLRALLQEAAA